MTNNKEKYAFWLTPEAKKMVESDVALGNCGSQSELVEKAVRFYDGYLKAQNAGAFLPHAVADVLEGTLGDVDMTREDYNKMRGNSVREINSTRGTISLKDVIQEDNY